MPNMEPPPVSVFAPLLDAARDLSLEDGPAAERAEQTLRERLDPESEEARRLGATLLQLVEEGRLANRGEPPVRWGRAAKPSAETEGYSIDVVLMNGAGPRHRHGRGEIDFCVAVDGSPTFDGRPPGWVVFPADSTHVPTVEGGTMLIVYLLPDGEIEFLN